MLVYHTCGGYLDFCDTDCFLGSFDGVVALNILNGVAIPFIKHNHPQLIFYETIKILELNQNHALSLGLFSDGVRNRLTVFTSYSVVVDHVHRKIRILIVAS